MTTIQVTTLNDIVDANDGVTSLREAIAQANTAGTQVTIQLGSGVHAITGVRLDITGDVILRGQNRDQSFIAHQASDRILYVGNGSTLQVDGITFDGTNAPEAYFRDGRAIYNDGGNISLANVCFANLSLPESYRDGSNTGKSDYFRPSKGGAIFNTENGVIDITNGLFVQGKAGLGGAIYSDSGYISIDASEFDGNVALFHKDTVSTKGGLTPSRLSRVNEGEGAAIYATGSARIDVFSNRTGTGQPTTFTNHETTTIDSLVNDQYHELNTVTSGAASLIDGSVYLDPAISVTGNTVTTLDGVTRDAPFLGPAAAGAPSGSGMTQNLAAAASAAQTAILTLLQNIDLSSSNSDLHLDQNAVVSQSANEIVFQLINYRLVVTGTDLAYSGDPLTLYASSPQSAVDAAAGIVTAITLQTANGSTVVGTVTGLSATLQGIVSGLALPQSDGSYAAYTNTLGTALSQAGGTGADILTGTASADILNGNGGDDTITGAAGNDTIDGGTDTDSAVYTGDLSGYLVFTGSLGQTVVLDLTAGRDGKDSLTNIENLTFNGTTLTVAVASVEPTDADGSAYQVYRFYNTATGSHFFTTSIAERNSVVENLDGFAYEGNAFDSNVTSSNGNAVYRFYNTETGVHFYTASSAEADNIRQTLSHFNDEGIAYYAALDASSGGTALYRFYNTQTGSHFFTVSEAERDSIIATLGQYNYEGISYYVDLA